MTYKPLAIIALSITANLALAEDKEWMTDFSAVQEKAKAYATTINLIPDTLHNIATIKILQMNSNYSTQKTA